MKLQIMVTKNYESAKKVLKPYAFIVYKKSCDALFTVIIKGLGSKILKDYSPIYANNFAIFTEENDDLEYLNKEKKKVDSFLDGDCTEFLESEENKKLLSNRWIAVYRSKLTRFMNNQFEKNSTRTILMSLSILVVTEILENKEKI